MFLKQVINQSTYPILITHAINPSIKHLVSYILLQHNYIAKFYHKLILSHHILQA